MISVAGIKKNRKYKFFDVSVGLNLDWVVFGTSVVFILCVDDKIVWIVWIVVDLMLFVWVDGNFVFNVENLGVVGGSVDGCVKCVVFGNSVDDIYG